MMELPSSRLTAVHEAIARLARDALQVHDACVKCLDSRPPERLLPGETAECYLLAVDHQWVTRDRPQRGRVPALPDLLGEHYPGGPGLWVSWYEKWEAKQGAVFALDALSWTFYWGTPASGPMTQVIRAEWDTQQAHPQPHWHIHAELLCEMMGRPLSVVDPSAALATPLLASAEPPGHIDQGLCLEEMHLGMGGRAWCSSTPTQECWTHRIEEEEQLVGWAHQSLQHCVCEIRQRLKRFSI